MGGLYCTSAAPFARMRLLIGGQQVEDISNYNTLHQALWRLTVPQDMADSLSGEQQGYYGHDHKYQWIPAVNTLAIEGDAANDISLRDTFEDGNVPEFWCDKNIDITRAGMDYYPSHFTDENGSTAGADDMPPFWPHKAIQCLDAINKKSYIHSPILGLLNNWRYLPLAYLGEMQLEIFLDDYDTVVRHNFAQGTAQPEVYYQSTYDEYVLSDVCYQADIVQFDDMYLQSFEAALAEKAIHIPYNTITTYKQSINAMRTDLQLQHRSRNVKALFLYPRRANYIRDKRVNSFMSLGAQGITSCQIRIGAFQKPLQPIDSETNAATGQSFINLAQAFAETMKALSFFGDVSHCPAVDTRQYRDAAFMLGLDLEREGGSSSCVDTASESTPIVLSLTSGHPLVNGGQRTLGTTNQGFDLDIFVHHENVLILQGPHEVVVFS